MKNQLQCVFFIACFFLFNNVSATDNTNILEAVKKIGELKYQYSCCKTDWDTVLLGIFREFLANKPNTTFLTEYEAINRDKKKRLPKLIFRDRFLHFPENNYDTLGNYPPVEYRLLALANCWNVLNFFHPYKQLFSSNWDSTFFRYLPLIILAKDAVGYHKTMMRFTAEMNDSHRYFYSPITDSIFGKYYCPFYTRFINDTLVVTNLYKNVFQDSIDIQIGDIIVKIDNKTPSEQLEDFREFVSASNGVTLMRNLTYYVLNGDSMSSVLTVLREGRLHKVTVRRYSLQKLEPIKWFITDSVIAECNGLIYFNLTKGSKQKLLYYLKPSCRHKFLFDLRGPDNCGLLEIITNKSIGRKILVGHTEFQGYQTSLATYLRVSRSLKIDSSVVLINEYTQSSSEYLAYILNTYFHCTLVGSHTAGAMQDVIFITLPGNISISFTRSKFIPIHGDELYGQGLLADEKVTESVSDIAARRDAYISSAYKLLCR